MQLLAVCPNGHVFPSHMNSLLEGVKLLEGAQIIATRNRELCYCGEYAETPDFSSRRVGDEILTSVRRPGVTKEHVFVFKDLAESVRRGDKNISQAAAELATVNSSFAQILIWAHQYGTALALLVGLLSLVIQLYDHLDSSSTSAQAHADAQSIETAIERQTELIAKLNALSQTAEAEKRPPQKVRQAAPPKKSTAGQGANRHERRKAKALNRKGQENYESSMPRK